MEENKLVTIASFTVPHEAHLAKSVLEAEGISAFVADEHLVSANLWMSHAVGGVKVKVRSIEVERAREILTSDSRFEKSLHTQGDWGKCPKCGSQEVQYFRDASRVKRLVSGLVTGLLLGIPWLFHSKKLRCDSCGNIWKIGGSE